MFSYAGKKCFVTGAGRGIGRATALCFARQGGDVAPAWRTESELAAIAADPAKYDTALADNTHMEAAGHWGVPLSVFDGEPFHGQDRFELLVWRLARKGLRKWAR